MKLSGVEGGMLVEPRRTIAVGLDGCSWNVLDPLLETGRLPNLAALRETGTSAILESTIPFFTGPAWASIATGCSPGAHGIYDFMMLRPGNQIGVAQQSDLRRPTYYQQLGRDGQMSVMVNLPLDQHGCPGAIIVNSWLTDDPERIILPTDLRSRYGALLTSYKTFPDDPSNLDELCGIESARFELARELFVTEPWNHFFILFSSTDWLGHQGTGRFLAGDHAARAAFLKLYEQLDSYIGWMREQAPDAVVFVLSDHGQCEETHVLRVNAVLHELGLVQLRDPKADRESPFFVDRRKKARKSIGIPNALGRYRTNRVVRPIALAAKRTFRRRLNIELTRASRLVDMASSAAFSPTDASFAVYVRDGSADEVERIRSALLAVKLRDGRSAIDDVWTPEELYGYPADSSAPTLLFSPALGVRPSTTIKGTVVSPPRVAQCGCHQRDGILIVAGPDVAAGSIGRASIYDVAPTLLWTMGAGVPRGVDGRVLTEVFDPEFGLDRPVVEVDPVELEGLTAAASANDEVESRLKALGYI
jgi:predicted AlkP superfamily phosphohydrolase/phosphomutase